MFYTDMKCDSDPNSQRTIKDSFVKCSVIWPLKGGFWGKCSLGYRPLHHDDMMRKGGGALFSSNIYLVHFGCHIFCVQSSVI